MTLRKLKLTKQRKMKTRTTMKTRQKTKKMTAVSLKEECWPLLSAL